MVLPISCHFIPFPARLVYELMSLKAWIQSQGQAAILPTDRFTFKRRGSRCQHKNCEAFGRVCHASDLRLQRRWPWEVIAGISWWFAAPNWRVCRMAVSRCVVVSHITLNIQEWLWWSDQFYCQANKANDLKPIKIIQKSYNQNTPLTLIWVHSPDHVANVERRSKCFLDQGFDLQKLNVATVASRWLKQSHLLLIIACKVKLCRFLGSISQTMCVSVSSVLFTTELLTTLK